MLLYCHCRIIFLLRALLLAPNIFSFFLRLVMSEVYEYLSRFRTSRRPALNRSCFVVSRGDYVPIKILNGMPIKVQRKLSPSLILKDRSKEGM